MSRRRSARTLRRKGGWSGLALLAAGLVATGCGSVTVAAGTATTVVTAPVAPGSVPGSVAPGSVAPLSVAPGSTAPRSVAPGSVAPGSVAPGSVAPGSGTSQGVTTTSGPAAPTPSVTPAPSEPGTGSSVAGGALSLIVEPDAGIAPIDELLAQPRQALDLVMYELVDTGTEQVLAADAARGVAVRVVLDSRLEKRSNTPAYEYLNAHGVRAVWAPTSYPATHEKAAVIDAGTSGQEALIMTLNLTSRYYDDTRDFALRDTNPADVAAIETAFDLNFSGSAPDTAPTGSDLVWSPGSAPALVDLINSATSTLAVENEEMGAPAITDALEAAGRRGVDVQVTMTRESDWSAAFDALVAAGVHVHTYPDSTNALYIHAKAIVVDGRLAFVGSENFSNTSLDENRELGLVTSAANVIGGLTATMGADWAGAAAWTG